MESFYATGLLFFLWPMVALTLLVDYVWAALCFGLSLWFAGVQGKWEAFKSRFFAVFITSFGADALLAAALLGLLLVAQSSARVAAWLEHPFAGWGGVLMAVGCIALVLLCGLLKWTLYRKVVLKRMKGADPRQMQRISATLAILTTPWTFLLPTAMAGAWMGEIMVAVGGVAGLVSPDAAQGLETPVP